MDLADYIHNHHLFGTLLSCLIWTFISLLLRDTVIRWVLPSTSHKKLLVLRKTDKELDKLSRLNATALLHASITAPIALYCLFFSPGVRRDPVNGPSLSFDILGLIMGGYFLYDSVICLTNMKLVGTAYVFHGIICFIGVFFQTSFKYDRLPYHLASFMATEMSTPFLHIRWFLTKSGDTNTAYFKILNLVFISIFVVYRLILLPLTGVADFFKLIYFREFVYMSVLRQYFMASMFVAFVLLNYYWGISFLRTQLRHLAKKNSKPSTTPKPLTIPLQDKDE